MTERKLGIRESGGQARQTDGARLTAQARPAAFRPADDARRAPAPPPAPGRRPAVRSGRGPSIGRRIRDLLLVAIAFAIAAASLTAYATFRIWQVGQQDSRRHVDAIVVLGAAQYNGRPSGALAARLDHAIELYKGGYAPYLITTGGKLTGDRYTEAQTGFNYATARGVPASAILMETTGGTTLESLRNVRAIFDAKGLNSALFVSDRSHMLRVLRVADDLGIEAWSSPTETSPDDTDPNLRNKSLLHELGAMAQYVFIKADE